MQHVAALEVALWLMTWEIRATSAVDQAFPPGLAACICPLPRKHIFSAGVKATTLVLLKAGARPDRADDAGKTAQSIAEEEGNHKLVDLLLEWAPARERTPEPEAHPIEPDAGTQLWLPVSVKKQKQ